MLFLKNKDYLIALILVISLAAFGYLYTSTFSAAVKGSTIVLLLLLTGIVIRQVNDYDGWSGFIMLRIKEGIPFIDWMKGKTERFWNTLCDIGLVFGFGLSSIFAFKHISKKLIAISIVLLFIFIFVIYSNIITITLSIINLPTGSGSAAGSASSGISALTIITLVALLAFGLVGMTVVALFVQAGNIVLSVLMFFAGNSSVLSKTLPGVSPVIPGVTIPLAEGIIALLILLVVHEGGHGVAARLAKVKIKSSGLLLLGFIPVGAFVDIDEKQMSKKGKKEKLRVSVAGSASNLATSLIFFIPTVLILSALPYFFSDHIAIGGLSRTPSEIGANLSVGSIIESINGVNVSSLSDYENMKGILKPNSTAQLVTDKGTFSVKTDSNAKIGIMLVQPIKPEFSWVEFVYITLGLVTVLNFFVAIINLLPMQAFDGHRILQDSISNRRLAEYIGYLLWAALLVNVLPWLWH